MLPTILKSLADCSLDVFRLHQGLSAALERVCHLSVICISIHSDFLHEVVESGGVFCSVDVLVIQVITSAVWLTCWANASIGLVFCSNVWKFVLLLLEYNEHWICWVFKEASEMHGVVELSLCVNCFIEWKIVMSFFQSIEGDVPVKFSERVGLRIHVHF